MPALACAAAPPQLPTLTSTVPREYVHRASFAEVLPTGWHQSAPDEFTVTAQWPRRHSFYTEQGGLHDPMLLWETIRQSLPLLSHTGYALPFGHRLSWERFRCTLRPEAMRIQLTPADLELRVSCSGIRRSRGQLAAISMDFAITRDGSPLATADTRFVCHSPAVYERLRAGRADPAHALATALPPAPPVPPHLVGRTLGHDVVLSPTATPRRWQLRADTSHPILFDHPVDHAPGVLLLEAARQAALATSPAGHTVPVELEVSFSRFVEYDAPCWITATPLDPDPQGRPRTHVTATQHDRVAYAATLTTESPAGRR
ncbi:ScbA/BarX family gamma-butyrolactone biosynthesis protein [Streptomyces chattanoogensis]|uniref:ScbA/BarX family gamma-butyrolactone biosynthesis protein n=1 Tax=Streptomyces chattanoogensis TaxID=66876 RepID=UPI0036A55B57